MQKREPQKYGDEATGIVYGNVGVGGTTYEMNKFQAQQGHGFAAERAEHVNDLLHGRDARILGDDNAKDGADRIVNGVEIQSKYCKSGSECVQACFRDGKYRYYSKNGEPMQVEVPYDMYDDAVAAMRRRIEKNEIDGITNPDEATNLVKRGHYTYEQVKRIAQAGTVESLTFDAKNGMILGANAMGVSATVTFAISLWNGDGIEEAVENAVLSGLKVGGVSFFTTIISSQLARSAVSSTIRAGTDILVRKLGPKAASCIVNSLNNGTNIYGAAAMKNVSKLMAGNIIASTVSLVVLSAGDIIDLFRGRISGGQMLKNTVTTGATVLGGGVGWGIGNALGSAVGGAIGGMATGGAGTKAGAKIGSKIGGFVASAVSGSVTGEVVHSGLDMVIEDDSIAMLHIVETEFASMCEQYLLTENEVYDSLGLLKEKLTKNEIKNIYASRNRSLYVQSIILSCINPVLRRRTYVSCPEEDMLLAGIRTLLEDAIEGTGIFDNTVTAPLQTEIQQRLLSHTNIHEEQLPQIMKPVVQMNRVQMRAERSLVAMKRSNEDSQYELDSLRQERESYKEELKNLLEES